MAKYKILYKLTHASGELVDASLDTPFEFEIGDGQLDPCLESCIKEAKVGKLQTFLLSADEAFGQADGTAIQVMNRAEFPKELGIELNNGVEFKTPTGDSYVGCIDKIDGDDITVNFNHPLAGCDVSFQVEILEKSKSPQ
ncbi:FKBP-type peptidyl-prolyl cis-trans isomerase [bacterium endosymbiont of Bathymodiolus sp. 5 South]|jgi:FKBP-type peptidyl-prolyl cis-trans isomerase 2|uniref:FKBP-type peptidyl-prolyl cis-trans isomerase n=1 Tax=bacterium endosymbiont of Bathymodiolus sp. 5 South TaxID=1181670 RepID=UPI0010B57B89|nr:FKBP-type peptidyl-prolyl cis-trans isomerase [bacterium endosymbiont of Bathymodiolus sp. 5 South]SHN90313.1 FKBP-type peptidyl-prolyl cis-trans isomerase SlpA [bacterium endosymbiont of Bathymodiolus sp. 5 South]